MSNKALIIVDYSFDFIDDNGNFYYSAYKKLS